MNDVCIHITPPASDDERRYRESGSGYGNFCSWNRLATEVLRRSGEISAREEVTHFIINENGINYRLRLESK